MPKNHHKKTLFEEDSRQGYTQWDISNNFNKLFGTLFKLIDFLPLHRNNQTEELAKGNKQRQRNKRKPNQFYIDLNKLETNMGLSRIEKERLRYIVQHLKCENKDEGTKERKQKSENRLNKRKKKTVKPKNIVSTKKQKKPLSKTHELSTIKDKNSTNKINKCCVESKCCSKAIFLVENKTPTKRKQRKAVTLLPERTNQSIIEPYPRSCGDTVRQTVPVKNQSSGTISEPQNISIKNIEFKYIRPTYVVQYSPSGNEVTQGRERLWSSLMEEVNLGKRPFPQYKDKNVDRHTMSLHYNEDPPRLIGVGAVTEQMIKEREHSQYGQQRTETVGKWQRDPMPSYLLPPEHRPVKVQEPSSSKRKRKEPKCKRLRECLKSCLGLSAPEDADRVVIKVESPMVKMNKDDFHKLKIRSPSKHHVHVTKITKEEFIKGTK